MAINVKHFLARQLNDHDESPSGVRQKIYFEWTEKHICDAIELSLCYLYSLLPQEFSEPKQLTVAERNCVINFCESCNRFLGLISGEFGDNKCISFNEVSGSTNSLSSLLSSVCATKSEDEADDSYDWEVVNGSKCVIKFNEELPKGFVINYLCAMPPNLDDLTDDKLCEYLSFIADCSLWWLFRTDSESRSNLDRARLHFEGMRYFVETKLLLEFSLREDDYNFGRRKVDD